MPELPEVQTTVDGINATVIGLRIVDVWTNYNSPHYANKNEIKNPSFFKEFKKCVVGSTIKKASRKAKNILIELSNEYTILIHMKMTGHVMYGTYMYDSNGKYITSKNHQQGAKNAGKNKNSRDPEKDPWISTEDGPLKDPFNRHIRLVFIFNNNKHLVLSDMRKFAKVTLVKTTELDTSSHLDTIGPEPLEENFTYSLFESRLLTRPSGKIKTVIIDQSIIAGVGNIYSDEALWRASIHPEEKIINIPKNNLKKLHTSIIEVLKQGIDFGGDSMSDYRNIHGERGNFQLKHQAYGRTNKPCEKKGCKGVIQRKVVSGRSAHFCNKHQEKLKIN